VLLLLLLAVSRLALEPALLPPLVSVVVVLAVLLLYPLCGAAPQLLAWRRRRTGPSASPRRAARRT
jgi:hypothetical protein